jgi:serine-type D-Ala-D-Ala carboxypeptidase/endopeptidase (penicillin-binding protein 4)
MTPSRWLRRFTPLGVLLAVAVASWTAASAADRDDLSTQPERYELSPVDPVLSARRIPLALQAPLTEASLRPQLEALIASSPPDSCLVVDVDGREVYRHNPSLPLVPASNQKLLTTFAALEVLGADTTFRTTVLTDAPVDGGVVDGSLWLVGNGDPLLMTDDWVAQFDDGDQLVRTRFEDLADALAAAGITEIRGAVVGDESHFDDARFVESWATRLRDQNQSGPLSALLVNEGISHFPDEYVSRLQYLPATNPAIHAATTLADLLSERGVTVAGGGSTGIAPPGAQELAAVESPPLRELIRGVNAWSNNTGAEVLVKAMDRATGGRGTTAGGTAAVLASLTGAGLPTEGLVVNDGSGLDEGARVTCQLLHAILGQAGPDSDLARSLAVGGSSGTLRTRFLDTAASGQVRAKTGTLRSVTALSGFASSTRQTNTVLTFAYVANVIDGVVELRLVDEQEPFAASLAQYPQGPTVADLAPRGVRERP